MLWTKYVHKSMDTTYLLDAKLNCTWWLQPKTSEKSTMIAWDNFVFINWNRKWNMKSLTSFLYWNLCVFSKRPQLFLSLSFWIIG